MNGRHPTGNMIRLTASFDRHCYCDAMKPVFEKLAPGEPIGVVALSGPVEPQRLDSGLAVLRSWGHELIEAPNLRARLGYLAGDDGERIRGLEALLNGGARVVFAVRGGYGLTRILDELPWRRMIEARVCFVGYSDLTALLNPLALRGGVVQIHGPVVSELARPDGGGERLREVLEGRLCGRPLFEIGDASVVRHGRASGRALGGNLSLVAALAGTPYAIDFSGAVVLLEDVHEPLYKLDRLLTQVRASGMFRAVKALISGNLHDCEPATNERWKRLLLECVPDSVPVVTGMPFGHCPGNMAFPIGARVELDTRIGQLVWRD